MTRTLDLALTTIPPAAVFLFFFCVVHHTAVHGCLPTELGIPTPLTAAHTSTFKLTGQGQRRTRRARSTAHAYHLLKTKNLYYRTCIIIQYINTQSCQVLARLLFLPLPPDIVSLGAPQQTHRHGRLEKKTFLHFLYLCAYEHLCVLFITIGITNRKVTPTRRTQNT